MTRVQVISDVHGRTDGLDRAGDGADLLLCLGDLACMIDYEDHGAGVLGRIFGADAVGRFVRLRAARRFAEARDHLTALWDTLGDDRQRRIDTAVVEQYDALLEALSRADCPVLLTYGNVDRPDLLRARLPPGLRMLDGERATVAGVSVGMVGGGLPGPVPSPAEVPVDVFAERLRAVEGVALLATHLPPHLPRLVYDLKGRRFEQGSVALLETVRAARPDALVFGHVHQPLSASVDLGGTRCRNVGHFRATGTPFVLDL